MTSRKRAADGMHEKMIPSDALAEVLGATPRTRAEIAKRLWGYIARHRLQDEVNRRNINADEKLRRVFGGKKTVSMFEMTALVSKHLLKVDGSVTATAAGHSGGRPRARKAPQPAKDSSRAEAAVARFLDKHTKLEATAERTVRLEQRKLRRFKFGNAKTAPCAICHRELPVELLVAAHIKPRSRCSNDEKRRVGDNVMGLCALGCDALFERGIIRVREDGTVHSATIDGFPKALKAHVRTLEGNSCAGWSTSSERFFKWHAAHHAKLLRRRADV